ncbi:hypothetical protein ACFRU3_35340 [Streptomyces sp. NPDC056910]|uniref:hypothetical protein n=1 Tax=Streptomyces sp. NPDC056910 TaxID=3345964 RepID=UPI0036ADBECB
MPEAVRSARCRGSTARRTPARGGCDDDVQADSGCPFNQIRTLIVTAPSVVRERLRGLSTRELIDTLARSRPAGELAAPAVAVRIALRRLARRDQALDEEIKDADKEIGPLVTQAAPSLIALPCVGPETAGQLLASAGDNPERLHSEASFAHLCGAAPDPPPPAAPTVTASTAVAIELPTTRSTPSSWSG